jgi:hypothetical protein
MLLQAIIGASFKAIEYFPIGTLHLSIASWMSNRGVANLDAKIFTVPLEGTTSKLGPIVGDDPIWDLKSTYDGLDKFHSGLLVDVDHLDCFQPLSELVDGNIEELVPPMVRGNGPTMSSPHTAKFHEGGIICSVYAGVWIFLAWNYHALQVFTSSMTSWRAIGQ